MTGSTGHIASIRATKRPIPTGCNALSEQERMEPRALQLTCVGNVGRRLESLLDRQGCAPLQAVGIANRKEENRAAPVLDRIGHHNAKSVGGFPYRFRLKSNKFCKVKVFHNYTSFSYQNGSLYYKNTIFSFNMCLYYIRHHGGKGGDETGQIDGGSAGVESRRDWGVSLGFVLD